MSIPLRVQVIKNIRFLRKEKDKKRIPARPKSNPNPNPIDSINDALNGLGGFCRLLFFVSPLPGHE